MVRLWWFFFSNTYPSINLIKKKIRPFPKGSSQTISFYASASPSVPCTKQRHLNTGAINSCPTCSVLLGIPKVSKYQSSFISLSLLTDNPIQLNSIVLSPGIMAMPHGVVHGIGFCYTDNQINEACQFYYSVRFPQLWECIGQRGRCKSGAEKP